jgi:hypothetical protein
MKRRLALGISVLALGWFGGDAEARTAPYQRTQVRPAAIPAPTPPPSPFEYAAGLLRDSMPTMSPAPMVTVVQPAAGSGAVAPASVFAADRPDRPVAPPAIQPVQYIVPSPSASAGGPPQVIVTNPVNGVITGPTVAATGCPCVIDECCSSSGVWSVDAGLYLLQPVWNNNPAYSFRSVNGEVDSREQKDFTHSLEAGPVVSVAYVSTCGLGGRLRYWQIDADAETGITNDGTLQIGSASSLGLSISDPGVGELDARWSFQSELRIRVFDAEATQTLTWDCYTFVLAAGLRYAQVTQTYDANLQPPGDVDPLHLSSSHRFRGVGPTLAAAARRPIGCTGLGLYAAGRGSLLYGRDRQKAFRIVPGTAADELTQAELTQDDFLPIFEIEAGLQYATCWNGTNVFFQLGFVGQSWLGVGNAANSDTLLGVTNDNDQANLGLLGLVISAGIDY